MLHSERFDPESVRLQLGIVANAWEGFLVQSRQLAASPMDQVQADDFVAELLRPYHTSARPVTESKAYVRIMQLFNGQAIGSDLAGVAGHRVLPGQRLGSIALASLRPGREAVVLSTAAPEAEGEGGGSGSGGAGV